MSKKGISLNQRKCVLEHISEMGMSGTKPMQTPLEQNTKFTKQEYDEEFKIDTQDELLTNP